MVLSSLFLCFKGKKNSRTEWNYSDFLRVSYSTLSEATDSFSSANLVGVGSFGSVYKVALYPGNRLVAVKVFNLLRLGASNSFTAECDIFRNIRHRNIVKIVTSCSSIDFRGNDFKALVYEFMENGSLEEWLHSTSTQNPPKNLDLLQRLNIAIDVACALDYLHNHCETPIVHCDLKPSNILLDNELNGRVSDFGLARFLSKTSKAAALQSSSMRSVGYVAPEYKKGSEASTDGDVYSFGILLLEMFTGKSPGDQMFHDDLNLHTYVKMALFQRVKEIEDPRLFQNAPTKYCARFSSQIQEECLSRIFGIAIVCSSKSARKRTEMGNVVSRLQSIRDVLNSLHGIARFNCARFNGCYDRSSIDSWIDKGNNTCPVTNQVLPTLDQIPNHALPKMIQDWCVQNRSHGVERIPTVSAYEVTRVSQRIMAATQRGDHDKCLELVAKVRAWGKDSERNRKCIVENRMGCCLSATFDFFAENEGAALLKEEILSVMPWMFPMGEEGHWRLGSAESLRRLVWFLEGKDLSSRQNEVLVLRKLLSFDKKHVDAIVEIEEAMEALVKIIREGPSPTATKASLSCVLYMISGASDEIKSRFVELGLVSLLLDKLVDAEKSLCERALGVLEGLCDCRQGRESAYENALTMPLLVKKMLRVSALATEFSVSIIWKLCRNQNGDGNDEEENKILMEALQVGAFQKLLLLLQVGCGDGIKDNVTEAISSSCATL